MTPTARGQRPTDDASVHRIEGTLGQRTPETGPPILAAGIVTLVVLALYVLTVAPTIQFWDTGEYIAAAKVLGIPHPPGNPLFVLVANLWARLPLAADYALRINLLSACASALASGFLFLTTERFLRSSFEGPRWTRIAAAAAGVAVGATSFTVWNQSVVNEKVYTLSLLSIALILWLTVRWADEPEGERRGHWLILIVYLLALSATNHLMGLLVAPAVFVLIEATEAGERLLERTLLGVGITTAGVLAWVLYARGTDGGSPAALLATVALLGALLWFAYSRAGTTGYRIVVPVVALGIAALTFETGRAEGNTLLYPIAVLLAAAVVAGAVLSGHGRLVAWSVVATVAGLSVFAFLYVRAKHYPPINEGEPTTWEALKAVLARDQYQKGPLIPRQADILWQYANYFQYLTWQFAHDWSDGLRTFFTAVFGGLGLLGAFSQWIRDRRHALTMTVLMVTVTLALVFYLDFKYGFSLRPADRDALTEVRERDYFFIASFQLLGVWVGVGFGALVEILATTLRGAGIDARTAWTAASPTLLLAAIPLLGNHQTAPRNGERLARELAWDLLQSVEPYGILVVAGDNDTFPLWYLQEVEGVRQDVLVANTSLMGTLWHNRQLKRRPIFPFDSANAIALYRGRTWERPSEPPLSPSYDELDALAPLLRAAPGTAFRLGSIDAVLRREYVTKADLVTLILIQDNLGERPIYFSQTAGNQPDALGLTPYLLSQGMVRRLLPDSVRTGGDTVATRGLGPTDLSRTETLLFEVYHPESAARPRPQGWVDPPSAGIMQLYWVLYASVADYYLSESRLSGAEMDAETQERALHAAELAEAIRQQTTEGQQE